LIAHATKQPLDQGWTIPKGMPDKEEKYLAAAKREFWEETSIDLDQFQGSYHYLGQWEYNHGSKKLVAYAFYSKEDHAW